MLFVELASITHSGNLLLCKDLESNDDSFRVHPFELFEIMWMILLCHSSMSVPVFETFSPRVGREWTSRSLFVYEQLIEPQCQWRNLHGWNEFAIFVKWWFTNMPYHMSGIVSSLNIARFIQFLHVLETNLDETSYRWRCQSRHTIRLLHWNISSTQSSHRISSMSRHDHFAMITIVRFNDIIGELLAWRSQLTFLLPHSSSWLTNFPQYPHSMGLFC